MPNAEIDCFLVERNRNHRYASFDYCYNYFYSFYSAGKINSIADENNIEMSCLQLGFYLASWGMLRASSIRLQRSINYYSPLSAHGRMNFSPHYIPQAYTVKS
jgi:hypothetical protein